MMSCQNQFLEHWGSHQIWALDAVEAKLYLNFSNTNSPPEPTTLTLLNRKVYLTLAQSLPIEPFVSKVSQHVHLATSLRYVKTYFSLFG